MSNVSRIAGSATVVIDESNMAAIKTIDMVANRIRSICGPSTSASDCSFTVCVGRPWVPLPSNSLRASKVEPTSIVCKRQDPLTTIVCVSQRFWCRVVFPNNRRGNKSDLSFNKMWTATGGERLPSLFIS